MSNLEKLEQLRSQMLRLTKDYQTQTRVLGTDKDGEQHRTRLKRLQQRWAEMDGKATGLLNTAPTNGGPEAADWQKLRAEVKDLRTEYENIDRDARGKMNAHRIAANNSNGTGDDGSGGAPAGGAASRGGQTAVRIQDFRQVDDAELLTEDAIQTEKLQGILDVQRDMNELQGMYHELHENVVYQQGGLDTAEKNIDQAQTHVEKGVVELKSANKLQKSSRKKMFILLGIIAVIVIVIIVVIIVTKK